MMILSYNCSVNTLLPRVLFLLFQESKAEGNFGKSFKQFSVFYSKVLTENNELLKKVFHCQAFEK